MKICLISYAFHPGVGGIETVSMLLAESFVACGHQVEVITETWEGSEQHSYPFPVHRRVSKRALRRLLRDCDVVLQSNISLNYLSSMMAVRRPLVIISHTPIDTTIEKSALKIWLKHKILSRVRHVTVSRYLASTFAAPSIVIYNPINKAVFFEDASLPRTGDLLFVGRITRCKGLDVLIDAMGRMKAEGELRSLTIVGKGEEEGAIRAQAEKLGVIDQLTFCNSLPREGVAAQMRRHQFVVVPSRPEPAEALGMVAVEAVACGAIPIVSATGGLAEAIGQCGLTFVSDRPDALCDALRRAEAPEMQGLFVASRAEHLKQFDLDAVVERYLSVLREAISA